jgi:hypothetical protein
MFFKKTQYDPGRFRCGFQCGLPCDLRFLDTSQILAPQIIPKSVPIWTVGHHAQVVSYDTSFTLNGETSHAIDNGRKTVDPQP